MLYIQLQCTENIEDNNVAAWQVKAIANVLNK